MNNLKQAFDFLDNRGSRWKRVEEDAARTVVTDAARKVLEPVSEEELEAAARAVYEGEWGGGNWDGAMDHCRATAEAVLGAFLTTRWPEREEQ